MGFLASIGSWLLKILLSGLFNGAQERAECKAKVEVESARAVAATADEARTVEHEIMVEREKVRQAFAERVLPDNDPFGFKAWNRGE